MLLARFPFEFGMGTRDTREGAEVEAIGDRSRGQLRRSITAGLSPAVSPASVFLTVLAWVIGLGGVLTGTAVGARLARDGQVGLGVAAGIGIAIAALFQAAVLSLFVGIHDRVAEMRRDLAALVQR